MKTPFLSDAFLSTLANFDLEPFTDSAPAKNATVCGKDRTFIKGAYENGLAEIEAGELALSRSAHPEVKAFAAKMIADHGRANDELRTIAHSKKVVLVSSPGQMKMPDADEADFDRAFADTMTSDYRKVVAAFEGAAREVRDDEVRAFVTGTLGTLKHHLAVAESLQQKVRE